MIGVLLVIAQLAQAQQPPRDTRPAPSRSTASIVGLVTSDESQPRPLRRARVTLNGPALGMGRTAITSDDGTFAFDGLPAGRYLLSATKDAYVTTYYGARRPDLPGPGITVGEREARQVTLRLPRGAVITGVVTDVDGQPAQGILITALLRRFEGSAGGPGYRPAGTSQSDDRGIYRIYGLWAGSYLVSAQPQAPARPGVDPVGGTRIVSQGEKLAMLSQVFSPAATDPASATHVLVKSGEERAGIDVRLQYVPLARVSGFVTGADASSAPTLQLVRLTDIAGERTEIAGMPVDAEGHFEFGNVPPGRYTISGFATSPDPAGCRVARTDIVVDGEDLTGVSVVLEPAFTIAGRLVIEDSTVAPTSAPEGATRGKPDLVLHLPLPLSTPRELPGMMVATVDLHGDRFTAGPFGPALYRRSNLRSQEGVTSPIGKWWLKSVVAGGRDLLDAPLEFDRTIDDAVATISEQASELTGRVTDAEGVPASEAFVVVFSPDRATWFIGSRRIVGVHPDKDGRYSIRNLPPGPYRVVAIGDVDEWEWFDPDVLDRLTAAAAPIAIAGVEKQTLDLVVR